MSMQVTGVDRCDGRIIRIAVKGLDTENPESVQYYHPVKLGSWYPTGYYDAHYIPIYQCTQCGGEVADEHIEKHNYCLHCGCKMAEI